MGLVCIFHGLGGNPSDYEHLVDYFNKKNYSACSLQLPEHTSQNTDDFNLTTEKINTYLNTLKAILSQESRPLFFVGISFGASFARYFADKFKAPLVNIAPFIEPYSWPNYLLLKSILLLDCIPGLQIGSKAAKLLPRFPVGRTINNNGQIFLPALSIYNAYRFAFLTHIKPINAKSVSIFLSNKDKTVSNFYTYLRYLMHPIQLLEGQHNLLNIDNPEKTINKIKSELIKFISGSPTSHSVFDTLKLSSLVFYNCLSFPILNIIKKALQK
ncbi:MAG: alpha/beta hydrolase [Candidatus Margulisiibacteriota bacterium]|nr:alpha/beta hydrolase [Candidatus Margulisiibacteriota bacterium]